MLPCEAEEMGENREEETENGECDTNVRQERNVEKDELTKKKSLDENQSKNDFENLKTIHINLYEWKNA